MDQTSTRVDGQNHTCQTLDNPLVSFYLTTPRVATPRWFLEGGAVFVDTAEDEARAPWAQQAGNWERPGMRLRDAAGHGIETFPQLRVVARVSAAAADLLFDGSGHTAAELARAAQLGRLHGFPLPATLALSAHTHIEPFDSRNVVGRLSGSDPVLGAEAIVYSAHLDHLGVVAPVDGDAIDNGALDNALGVAITLETARQLRDAKATRKRTLLFVALTAEEQGLLGAQWFVLHPPARLVADINLDMPMLLAPARDVVPIGAAHSSLQDTLARAAAELGVGQTHTPPGHDPSSFTTLLQDSGSHGRASAAGT